MAKASDFEGKNPDELFYVVEYSPEEAEKTGYSNYSYWGSVFHNFLKKKSAVFCALLFLFLVIFTFVALAIGKYDYATLVVDQNNKFISPNSEYWFGTDNIGRDYWCQVWFAAQTSIRLALVVALGEGIVGIIIGLIWGYVRSLDRFFTELYNLINNIPIIIYMTLIALMIGQSFTIMAISLIATGWLNMARGVRNMVFMYRDREYNLASRCLGTPAWRIMVKNLLPYLVSILTLRMALAIPAAIGNEVFITYIGLGVPLEVPTLGNLINSGQTFINEPTLNYQLFLPVLILSIVTISFYVVGNSFADAADPKNHVN